ncbi:MAG TPA: hypothetical protein VMV77_04940 [Bacteroidales bacterium]|nr:hypothetical protein [Bacteroidales bacterium]
MEKLFDISIVIAGKWNVKIFTPFWMLKELIGVKSKNGLIEVAFNQNSLQPIYKHKTIQLIPTDSLFEIKIPKPFNIELLKEANSIAIKLLHLLPYTPELAVGFNFRFKKPCSISNFKIDSYHKDYNVNTIQFSKKIDNFIINVILNCENDKQKDDIVFYNFHYKDTSIIKEDTIIMHFDYLKKKELWE